MAVDAPTLRTDGRRALTVSSILLAGSPVLAQAEEAAAFRSAPVVVSGTRVERNSFDLPMSIDVFGQQRISEGQLGVNASEALQVVPGVVANNQRLHRRRSGCLHAHAVLVRR